MKIFRILKAPRVTILAYHRIISITEEFNLCTGIISATSEEFEKQIQYLSKKYFIISFKQLEHLARSKKKDWANYLLITFDDGYKDNYINAYPILLKYGVPATFFVTTGLVGKKIVPWWDKLAYLIKTAASQRLEVPSLRERFPLDSKEKKLRSIQLLNEKIVNMSEEKKEETLNDIEKQLGNLNPGWLNDLFMSWEEIAQMKANGMEFFPHTMTHCNLAKASLKKAKKEIADSKSLLERKLGTRINVFCYPYGSFNCLVKKIIKKMEFFCALSTNFGINYLTEELDWHSLKRIEVSHKDSLLALKMKINWFTHKLCLCRLKERLR